MPRWPIERNWAVIDGEGNRSEISSVDLQGFAAVCLLGPAGLGKTFELRHLAEAERSTGLDVREVNLAVMAQTADSLEAKLVTLSSGVTENTVLHLDALDELMVPVQRAGAIVASWIGQQSPSGAARIRISCRSAVFPEDVHSALVDRFGKAAVARASLQPLSLDDIATVAIANGINGKEFLAGVKRSGASTLAEQPLTLEMLLRIYKNGGRLPAKRGDLFFKGINLLVLDRAERRERGTSVAMQPQRLLDAAERLACMTLFSGKESIDYGDDSPAATLGLDELLTLPGEPLDYTTLRAIRQTGLADGDGPFRFRFSHRQIAEYLAGRRIAKLLSHQARSLLASPLGSHAGVAGPLRETAAFAAIENPGIAAWIAETDPEVIGLSDVVDGPLRRLAATNLLSQLRRHQITDSTLWRTGIELGGLRYERAEGDLRPVLQERGPDCEDVLEGAVKMIDAWELKTMSGDLASLVLDSTAPLNVRKSAGYSLVAFGSEHARRRLKPLIAGRADDLDDDLKGLALQCNYPDSLSVPELLTALTEPKRSTYGGAYSSFLYRLQREGFDAPGHRLAALSWARRTLGPSPNFGHLFEIAKHVVRGALADIHKPRVAKAIAGLLIGAAQVYSESPLSPSRIGATIHGSPDPLADVQTRHLLIDALTQYASADRDIWWAARESQFLRPEDLDWLLERSKDTSLPMARRVLYAEVARSVPIDDQERWVKTWLGMRDHQPAGSRLPFRLVTLLDSEEAKFERAEWRRRRQIDQSARQAPPQADVVEEVLRMVETKDHRYFFGLCRALAIDPAQPGRLTFDRFLTRSPGWLAADGPTRARIVLAAKTFLTRSRRPKIPAANAIETGYMAALWLVMEVEANWLGSRPAGWWTRWTPYFVRQVIPHLSGEPNEPKITVLALLHARAPKEVRSVILAYAGGSDDASRTALIHYLEFMREVDDPALDEALCRRMERGRLPAGSVTSVSEFLIHRNAQRALRACYSRLTTSQSDSDTSIAVAASVALLGTGTKAGWDRACSFIESRPDLAQRILGEFSQAAFRVGLQSENNGTSGLTTSQVGQLVGLLIRFFSPETDPHHDGAHTVTPDDSARNLRMRLLSWLGDQRDEVAIGALRTLESTFGQSYPWLRRPRAAAERAFRLSQWNPVPVRSIADILAAADKRLIRSADDAAEGIIEAVSEYDRGLKHERRNEIDDLWDRPRRVRPSPKDEEHASEKILAVIRDYFTHYAVTADREVQIYRRTVPIENDGLPGSELDVLCRVPSMGTVSRDRIAVPVEVKLSHNREARTGLREQLATRYMSQLDTSVGVYVLVWLKAPNVAARYRPVWRTREIALQELSEQARALSSETGGALNVRVVLIDASLPVVGKEAARKGASRRAKTGNVKGLRRASPRVGRAKTSTKKSSSTSRPPIRRGKRRPSR